MQTHGNNPTLRPHDNGQPEALRILIADQEQWRLARLAEVLTRLGHEVVARETDVTKVAAATTETDPDVALVSLGDSTAHALQLIGEIVREASSPVIVLLATNDRAFISEAARRGVFAYIVDSSDEELQSAIEITLQRFSEFHSLKGAFGRRALIEQAKGILMARHAINAEQAFTMLRNSSQSTGRKVAEIADGIISSHVLLPASPSATDPPAAGPPASQG
ncbi:MAG: ANTAR domain-containing protein [Thermoleophilia bacterium]|nr:ANTAR domain-containing protein [Thermoleophilia bacterium]